jgi:ribosomal protein L1
MPEQAFATTTKGYTKMAKKADLLVQAKELGLEVTEKNTIAEIEAAIAGTDTPTVEEKKTAKAGKRSEKSLKEAEEKAEKEARKDAGDTSPQDEEAESRVKKGPTPVTRPLIERRGKKYQEAAKKIEEDKLYSLAEALAMAPKTSPVKFDASVEVHVRLGVDPRQADQNIRSTVSLPHGTGKKIRVAVFAPSDQHDAAKKAGADIVGEEDFLQLLDKDQLDFDVLIATPQLMPRLGKYARSLGPRGLMPNPKSGTVAADVAKATKEAKAGKVEYRVDKQAIVHLAIGKVSFGGDKLVDNAKVFFESIATNKPSSLKGTYIKTVSVSTTQGPGIKVDIASL